MGREVRAVPESAPLKAETPSIGAYLRSQRLLRGIGLAELSVVTRIPRRSLDRLEQGEFDAQPDGFARGFVRAVATALGLDPDDAVSRMLTEVVVPEASGHGLPWGRAAVLLAAAGLLALGVVLWGALSGGDPAPRAPDGDLVIRRDAVRSLASEVEARAGPPVASQPGVGSGSDPDAASPGPEVLGAD